MDGFYILKRVDHGRSVRRDVGPTPRPPDGVGDRRLCKAVTGLCTLIVFGSCGYALIEGWSILDGFFMTVITVSTVGYGETNELSQVGRWFTSGLIFMCVVGMTYLTASQTIV